MNRKLTPDSVCIRCGASDWIEYHHANGQYYMRCKPCLIRIRRESIIKQREKRKAKKDNLNAINQS